MLAYSLSTARALPGWPTREVDESQIAPLLGNLRQQRCQSLLHAQCRGPPIVHRVRCLQIAQHAGRNVTRRGGTKIVVTDDARLVQHPVEPAFARARSSTSPFVKGSTNHGSPPAAQPTTK